MFPLLGEPFGAGPYPEFLLVHCYLKGSLTFFLAATELLHELKPEGVVTNLLFASIISTQF